MGVAMAREELMWSLQTLSLQAVELTALWEAFASKLLVDVTSPDFLEQLPMEVDAFKGYQVESYERAKGALWTTWVPKSSEVFRRRQAAPINGDTEAYFRSVSTLQSKQLRQLVQDSLDAFVAFFQRFAPSAEQQEVDPQQDSVSWTHPPAFSVKLAVSGTGYVFVPSFEEIQDTVRAVLEGTVTAVAGIPRIGSTANVARGQGLHIPTVGLEEQSVAAARRSVERVLEDNFLAPRGLAALFDRFLYLFEMSVSEYARAFGDKEHSLEEYAAKIDEFRAAAVEVENTSLNEVRRGAEEGGR